jgi:hypothetical protein
VKERFLTFYVLNRFQDHGEDLTDYVTSVVEAAKILGFAGSESQLVCRMVQNMHPSVKSHLFFQNRPQSVGDLFQLATTVTEAVAVEEQRGGANMPVLRGSAPQPAVACLARAGMDEYQKEVLGVWGSGPFSTRLSQESSSDSKFGAIGKRNVRSAGKRSDRAPQLTPPRNAV